jgi:hypothetical protein
MAIKKTGSDLTTREQTADWVKKALAHADMGQAELSNVLIRSGFLTMDRSVVNKLTLAKRDLKATEMFEISRITGYPVPDLFVGSSKSPERAGVDAMPLEEASAILTEPRGPGRPTTEEQARRARAQEIVDAAEEPAPSEAVDEPYAESAPERHDSNEAVSAQRETRRHELISEILKFQGATPALAEKVLESIDKEVNAQSETLRRTLLSKAFEDRGLPVALAERLALYIAVAADVPQDPQSGTLDMGQVKAEARLLAALFDPKRQL